jgi:hypothetical protein
MSVLVELHNTGDATIRTEVQVIVEHILSDRPGEWRVSIVGSRAKEDWEMKVEGPNGNLAAARGSRDDNDSLAGLIVTFFSGICLEQNLGPDRARITKKIDAFMRLIRAI